MLNFKSTQIFLETLKCSIWGKVPNECLYKNLSIEDWEKIFELSLNHTVDGHIASVILMLPEDRLPPKKILLKWMVRLQRVEEQNYVFKKVICQQAKIFEENGVNAILMKGQAFANYYFNPKLRVNGDIDWFFPTKLDYLKANELMDRLGKEFNIQNIDNCHYFFEGIKIEHHFKIIELTNPFVQSSINKIVEGLSENYSQIDLFGQTVKIPNPMINILLVTTHILKHQVTFGIGLRQIVDSVMVYDKLISKVDIKELNNNYKKLGILNWIRTYHNVMVEMLDFPISGIPSSSYNNKDTTWMREYILKTGNFGVISKNDEKLISQISRFNRFKIRIFNFRKFFPLAPFETFGYIYYFLRSKFKMKMNDFNLF